ncbi:thioredoxin [Dactylosporangium sp. NPDC048998]|uniref:thioredoxin n=1 Tax=Dactylosporangium sp. NPDC048998 TaxID=3363976 RepID=UPI00371D859F
MDTVITSCPHCGKKNRLPASGPGAPRCGNCRHALPWIVPAGDDSFAEVVEHSSIPVVVDLWATWCAPCHAIGEALEQLAADLAGRLKVVKVDVDASARTAARFDVQSVPTVLLFDGGHLVSRRIGAVPAAQLRQWVEQTVEQTRAAPSAPAGGAGS